MISFVFVCCGIFAVSGFAQESGKAWLVDEHPQLACDDSLARLDAYYEELRNKPSATGLVVISAKPELKHLVAFREGLIVGHGISRSFPSDRIEIVRAVSDDELKVQFWIVPPGAERPEVSRVDMSYSLPSSMKPFRLGVEYVYGDQICPEVSDFAIFAKFLKDNPSARGNLVVRERTLRQAEAEGRRLLRQFERDHGISRERLRVFPTTPRADDYNVPLVEYWFLP